MKCPFCDGTMESRNVTFSDEGDDGYFLVENVPAEVCNKCGGKTFSPQVTDDLLKISKPGSKPVKTVSVPIFDFAKET